MMVIKRQLLNHQSKKRIIHLTREGALCQKKKLHALNLPKDQKKGKNIHTPLSYILKKGTNWVNLNG